MIERSGHVHGGTVGQMTALRQIHTQHCVSGLQQGKIHRQIGLGAGMRLHVGMLRAEELTGPLSGKFFHKIHTLAATVIPLAGVALRIFIGQHAAHGRHYRGRNDILRSDQLQVSALAGKLLPHCLPYRLIFFCDKPDGIHQILKHTTHPFPADSAIKHLLRVSHIVCLFFFAYYN